MIPTYDKFMLPMLRALADGATRTRGEISETLAAGFGLTEEELAHRIPSGAATTFANRLAWARTRLVKAGLLESPSRGLVRITEAGRHLLVNNPAGIGERELMQIRQYREWIETARAARTTTSTTILTANFAADSTPEEVVIEAEQEHRRVVEEDLLARVSAMNPYAFEDLVVELLLALGYGGLHGEGRPTRRSGDGGIDGVIWQDKLGLERVYVQAKRWSGQVGSPVVQGFVGSLVGNRAAKGVMITTSDYSRDAIDFAASVDRRVVLINGKELARLMYDADVGVTVRHVVNLKTVDSDRFDDPE